MELKNLNDIIKAVTTANYRNKQECVKLAEDIRIHADGKVPTHLICVRRPNEPEEIKNYREKIYVPITKNSINKVIHSLEKIRRAQDWNIQYDTNALVSSVADDERMEKYCEEDYPGYTSITNWAFSELLKRSLIDANGIVAVVLDQLPSSRGEYSKPVARFFESSQIVDYVEGEYAVLKSQDTTEYYLDDGKGARQLTYGAIYYVLTKTDFVKYEQVNKDEFKPTNIYTHNIGKLPAWKVGGLYLKRVNNDTIYESRIAAMVPNLNEAAREYSDLQAEILLHIHSEKYAYVNSECPDCNGTGKKLGANGERVVCDRCGGTGKVLNTSPYGMHLISAGAIGENSVPTPPIGYLQKDTSIAKLQDERVRDHIYDALASINMEFLAETPLSQSGTAKEVDKDELNNFVNAIAEDLVRNLDNVYYFIGEYRYRSIVSDEKKRRAMYPKIGVPTKFDMMSTAAAMERLKNAREAKVNPEILRELEIDYAKKEFNTDPEIAMRVETTFTLDPMFGVDDENKMTQLQNGGVTKVDYIVSCNIHTFVRRAVFENEDFYTLDFDKQMEILRKYAEDIAKEAEDKAASAAGSDFGGLGNSGGTNGQQSKNEPTGGEE